MGHLFSLWYSRFQKKESTLTVPIYNPLSKNFTDEETAKLRGTAVLSLKGEYHRILVKQPFVV